MGAPHNVLEVLDQTIKLLIVHFRAVYFCLTNPEAYYFIIQQIILSVKSIKV